LTTLFIFQTKMFLFLIKNKTNLWKELEKQLLKVKVTFYTIKEKGAYSISKSICFFLIHSTGKRVFYFINTDKSG